MTMPEEVSPDMAELLPALARLPRPELPPEVAARLDAAIARAVADRAASGTAQGVSGPQGASSGPRRAPGRLRWRLPRVRTLALGAVATCAVAALAVSLSSIHTPETTAGPSTEQNSHQQFVPSPLSTAPVTDPALLSWAASALQHHVSPLTAETGDRNGNSTASSSSAPSPYGLQPLFGASNPAVSCVPGSLVSPAGSAPRQLLASISGDYQGQPAELSVYTNGDDSSSAFIVVFALPCQVGHPTVLASGVVPR
jgi:hypothetical protein